MHDRGSRVLSVALAVLSLMLSSSFYLCYGERVAAVAVEMPVISTAVLINTNSVKEVGTVFTKIEEGTELADQGEPSEQQTKNTTSENTKEKKLGKVMSQFLSPYNANTSYNNIYVNNQSGKKINIKKLTADFKTGVELKNARPQVLIMHTHGTENYVKHKGDYYTQSDLVRTSNETQNVIGVGNRLAEVLEKGGVTVLHDKTLHDSPSYSGSYNRAAVTVQNYLKKYPSIKVVLDVHRDAIGSGDDLVKPVTEINGKQAAQVMICVGSETGSIDYFPKWQENLKLGLKLQQTMEVMYPGLARALYLSYEHSYNQDLHKGSIIIEFGTNGNNFEEAEYSATLVGNSLVTLFKN